MHNKISICHFPIEWLWHHCQKSHEYMYKGLFLGSPFFSQSVCLSLCQYIILTTYQKCETSNLFFISKINLAIQGPLRF